MHISRGNIQLRPQGNTICRDGRVVVFNVQTSLEGCIVSLGCEVSGEQLPGVNFTAGEAAPVGEVLGQLLESKVDKERVHPHVQNLIQ